MQGLQHSFPRREFESTKLLGSPRVLFRHQRKCFEVLQSKITTPTTAHKTHVITWMIQPSFFGYVPNACEKHSASQPVRDQEYHNFMSASDQSRITYERKTNR